MKQIDIAQYEWQVITNPNALTRERELLKNIFIDAFDTQKIQYQFHIANGKGCGASKAQALCNNGYRYFIIIGGDGTINEVINGIYTSNADPSEVFVAIVPLGTGNDYCRTLRMPSTPDAILQTLLAGNFAQNDVGIVETREGNQVIHKRHFINIAGFAFDAAVIHATPEKKPKLFPSTIYLLTLLKVLFKYKSTPITLKTQETTYSDNIFTIAVGIAQYNGNGMRQVPMANPSDRIFDIVVIRKLSPWKAISKIGQLFKGEHINTLSEVSVFHSDEVEIISNPPILGEVEGETLPQGDYRIYNAPTQINILCNTTE